MYYGLLYLGPNRRYKTAAQKQKTTLLLSIQKAEAEEKALQ